MDCLNTAANQAARLLRICQVASKGLRVAVESVETLVGADPNVSEPILTHSTDSIMTDALGTLTIVPVGDERAPIVSVESVIASEPQEAPTILKNTRHCLDRNTLAGIKMFELDAV